MLKTWSELSRVKSYRNYLKGNKNFFKLAGGYQGYSKCMEEIKGKSILVRVSEGSSYQESTVPVAP